MRLLSAFFCPATAALAVCLGKTFWDSKLTAWIRQRHTGRSTAPCAHETACVHARTQYVAQTIVPSSSHRHDVPEVEFKKKTPMRPSENFQRLVRHETSICRVLQIPSRPRCHGVTLVRKLRFTALYWPSNGVSLQKRRPKASTDDHPSTQNCATSLRRREPLCLVYHVHTLPLAIAIAMDDQDPAPNPSARPPPQFSSNFAIAIF